MNKTILVYCWNSVCEPMVIHTMKKLGHRVLSFDKKIKDYHADAEFAQGLIQLVHSQKVELVFSYDYFPLISMICEMNRIPYASWIYDCPQYTLLSKSLSNTYNHLFCFDEAYALRLCELGARNVYHFPLAADTKMYETAVNGTGTEYTADISFVGSLYNDKKNRLANTDLSDYAAGYVDGLILAQQKIYGYNLIKDSLPENIAGEIAEKCNLMLGDSYVSEPLQMATDAINMEVTARDRRDVLDVLATDYNVTLYSNSELPDSLKEKTCLEVKGTVDYHTQMPLVFQNSKINLNITSRTIETGVPQRVFDILACGGFCMTNYQKEIAELFVDGKELVMYTSLEDLMQKVEYYLQHEEEREKIAREGYEKVCQTFEIKEKMKEMLAFLT